MAHQLDNTSRKCPGGTLAARRCSCRSSLCHLAFWSSSRYLYLFQGRLCKETYPLSACRRSSGPCHPLKPVLPRFGRDADASGCTRALGGSSLVALFFIRFPAGPAHVDRAALLSYLALASACQLAPGLWYRLFTMFIMPMTIGRRSRQPLVDACPLQVASEPVALRLCRETQ